MNLRELTETILSTLRTGAKEFGIDDAASHDRIVRAEPGIEPQPEPPSLCVYVVPGNFFANVQAPWAFQATFAIECFAGSQPSRSDAIDAAHDMAMQVVQVLSRAPSLNPMWDIPAISFEQTRAEYSSCKLIFLHQYYNS